MNAVAAIVVFIFNLRTMLDVDVASLIERLRLPGN